jgi:hypothetical protein
MNITIMQFEIHVICLFKDYAEFKGSKFKTASEVVQCSLCFRVAAISLARPTRKQRKSPRSSIKWSSCTFGVCPQAQLSAPKFQLVPFRSTREREKPKQKATCLTRKKKANK